MTTSSLQGLTFHNVINRFRTATMDVAAFWGLVLLVFIQTPATRATRRATSWFIATNGWQESCHLAYIAATLHTPAPL